MFAERYGSVAGWLFGVGVLVGAVGLLAFALVVPPDRGEEGVRFILPFFGGFFGAISAAAASLTYWIGLGLWIRGGVRSVASRAWIGAASAGFGVATLWVVFGLATSGPFGLVVWGPLGGVFAVIAGAVAGPLTARASRLTS